MQQAQTKAASQRKIKHRCTLVVTQNIGGTVVNTQVSCDTYVFYEGSLEVKEYIPNIERPHTEDHAMYAEIGHFTEVVSYQIVEIDQDRQKKIRVWEEERAAARKELHRATIEEQKTKLLEIEVSALGEQLKRANNLHNKLRELLGIE